VLDPVGLLLTGFPAMGRATLYVVIRGLVFPAGSRCDEKLRWHQILGRPNRKTIKFWLARIAAIRAVRHQVPDLCRHCGYDMRATRDRCPECGTYPGKNAVI